MQEDAAYQHIVNVKRTLETLLNAQNDVNLSTKSSASMTCLALEFALTSGDGPHGVGIAERLVPLLAKIRDVTPEFNRKLSYRLLQSTRIILVVDTIRRGIDMATQQAPARNDDVLPLLHLLQRVLCVTVDIRHYLMETNHDLLRSTCRLILKLGQAPVSTLSRGIPPTPVVAASTIFTLPNSDTRETFGRNSAASTPDHAQSLQLAQNAHDLEMQQYRVECLETLIKFWVDITLMAEYDHSRPMLNGDLRIMDCVDLMIRQPYPTILEPALRLLSYIYELATDNEDREYLSKHPVWTTLFENTMFQEEFRLPLLQHFATHLIPCIPEHMKTLFKRMFEQLSISHVVPIQNYATRCGRVVTSLGVRIGVEVSYRENIAFRKTKAIWMKRCCEGCQITEKVFGEFMMCAGCRKVRYCSKECQVKDWKYHRMSCHFFRPRPGFRSRGTQTPTEVATQTSYSVEGADGMMIDLDEASMSEPSRPISLIRQQRQLRRVVPDRNTETPPGANTPTSSRLRFESTTSLQPGNDDTEEAVAEPVATSTDDMDIVLNVPAEIAPMADINGTMEIDAAVDDIAIAVNATVTRYVETELTYPVSYASWSRASFKDSGSQYSAEDIN